MPLIISRNIMHNCFQFISGTTLALASIFQRSLQINQKNQNNIKNTKPTSPDKANQGIIRKQTSWRLILLLHMPSYWKLQGHSCDTTQQVALKVLSWYPSPLWISQLFLTILPHDKLRSQYSLGQGGAEGMQNHSGRLSNLMMMPLSLYIALKWNLGSIGSKAYRIFSNMCLRLLNEEIFQVLSNIRKAAKSKLILTHWQQQNYWNTHRDLKCSKI